MWVLSKPKTKQSSKKFDKVYQLKIVLDGLDPLIWRRILVPCNYSFARLDRAIQSAMGWTNSHLHEFIFDYNPEDFSGLRIGMELDEPYDNYDLEEPLMETEHFLKEWFPKKKKFKYLYDFGDHWMHSITVEKTIKVDPDQSYPQCLEGEYACPPEDCGGLHGFTELMSAWFAIKEGDSVDEEMQERIDYYIKKNPLKFNPKTVRFLKRG